ncbi:hypothetical protein [Duganella sp. BJB1802]|uniref:hypothetical protein n=1 Tax=Duganella sp. BJB1802 TaxID=2744575 RepID=UPI001E630606|nr:hypothetical protein [Duganella sp. BJB1802]
MAVDQEPQAQRVRVLNPPLASFPVYHYLNKQRSAGRAAGGRAAPDARRKKAIEAIQQRVANGS